MPTFAETSVPIDTHLIPKCPHADLFGGRGRSWLGSQPVPDDERIAIERHMRELDLLGEDLVVLARAMLVEAAWAAANAPGPLHAFLVRVRAKRRH
ncbi:hypothetical protein [Mesorhizobium sp.]|uniref:hypothetical protein n=1 Tax=Mesorhizobium sp. TaxID=1871066 RepID=UPI0025E5DBFF|nr:hypothetical protein [Mesorhizobium sp.]